MLYAAIFAAFRLDHPAAERTERFVRTALTESFDFGKAEDWYKRHVGTLPSFLPAFEARGQSGNAYAPAAGKLGGYETAGRGIRLTTGPDAEVQAVLEGWVVYVGELPGTGLTVIMRHSGGLETIYGWLESASVGKSDWLKGGAMIGTVQAGPGGESGKLYFAARKHGAFVDPGEVISLD